MKLCRFNDNRLGLVEGDLLLDVTSALDALPAYRYPLPETDQLIANLNAMLGRIQQLMDGLRQVSSDIAHDLRTPLGRLRQNLEDARDLVRGQEGRSAPPEKHRVGDRRRARLDATNLSDQCVDVASLEVGVEQAAIEVAVVADGRAERLHALLKLAEDAGAKVETLAGTNAIEAITGYIRRHNITKAVIGRPPEKRWRSPRAVVVALRLAIGLERRLPSGDFAEALARHCPEVDVIRAAADPARIQLTPKAAAFGRADVRTEVERAADAQPGWLTPGYLAAGVYVGIATALSSLVRPVFDLANIVMLFLAAVVAVAMRHGRGPAALASVLSVALFDFFFVPPRWSMIRWWCCSRRVGSTVPTSSTVFWPSRWASNSWRGRTCS